MLAVNPGGMPMAGWVVGPHRDTIYVRSGYEEIN